MQRRQRIGPECTESRDGNRGGAGGDETEDHGREGQQIGWGYLIEQRAQQPDGDNRSAQPQRQSGPYRRQALA